MNNRVLILKNKHTGDVIGHVPYPCGNNMLWDCIKYLDGKIVRNDDTVIFNDGKRHSYRDLLVIDRVVNYDDITNEALYPGSRRT